MRDGVLILRPSVPADRDILVIPELFPCLPQVLRLADRIQVGGEIVQGFSLIAFQFHKHSPLYPGDIPRDLFECDVPSIQLIITDKAAVGINHVRFGTGFDGAEKFIVQ